MWKLPEIGKSLGYHWYVLKQDPLTIVGLAILATIATLGTFAQFASPYDPYATSASETLHPPSIQHLFGTDSLGRDILSRCLRATQIDLPLALFSVFSSFLLGLFVGSISGYWRGNLDEFIMRIMDVLLAFPNFVLAIGLMAAIGPGMFNLYITQVFIRIPIFARLVRGEVLSQRENEYVDAAVCAGDSGPRILFRHILPNSTANVLIALTYNLGYCVLNIAALSFLGLGINPPNPEWGIMVSDGARYIMTGEWWLSIFPGLFIILTVLAFNLAGDGITSIMDPRRKRV
jgi:peptide/nickel transport system permease protein